MGAQKITGAGARTPLARSTRLGALDRRDMEGAREGDVADSVGAYKL